MSTCSRCGSETVPGSTASMLCPACLLRLGLEGRDSPAGLDMTGLRVIAPVGRGPDAMVYLGQLAGGEPPLVTLKLYDQPLDAPRFITRVQGLVEQLQSCEVAPALTILDAGSVGPTRAFAVSRYVPGVTVDAYFRGVGRRRRDALSLLARVSRLVSQLHRAGIAHGAIKSSNVVVTQTAAGAEPVLLDAGLRFALESSRLARSRSASQVSTRPESDRRSDIAGLRMLAADVFASRGGPDDATELIQALARREFESASDLADQAAALASRASS